MSRAFRLLIVEDHQDDAELLVAELVRAGFSPDWTRVDTLGQLIRSLSPAPAVILCDYSLPGLDALGVLNTLRERSVDVPVIVVSGQMDEETCVKSLRMGAVDYLLKDRLIRLGPAVEHALTTRQLAIEKREAERKERETASILRGLVAHAPAAISVKAVDGRYLLANRQFETLYGQEPSSLVGRIDADVFPAERAREMIDLDARCLHNSIVVEREEELGPPDDPRSLLCVRYPVIDENQEVFGIGAIYLEITRQKRIEADLRAARVELLSRAERLGASNEKLRELDRMKTEFIGSISHELRTPLTSIRGYLEMLREGGTSMEADLGQRFLAIIDRNAEQLLGLIEDLLMLSRIDSGKHTVLDRAVSFPQIVSAAISIVTPAVEQAGLLLSIQIDDDLPAVRGDSDQLERVLVNLLTNAVKFSADVEDGVIDISVRAQDGGVSLAVRDRGIGIPPADQHRLFTRFFRSAAATERGIPGTGLGLAVVKGIVEAHRGSIRVDSIPGRLTTMTIQLPGVR